MMHIKMKIHPKKALMVRAQPKNQHRQVINVHKIQNQCARVLMVIMKNLFSLLKEVLVVLQGIQAHQMLIKKGMTTMMMVSHFGC